MPIAGDVAPLAAWSPDLLADCHVSLRQLHAYWDARRGARDAGVRRPRSGRSQAESAEDTIFYLDRVVQPRQPALYRGTYQPLTTRTQRDDVLFLPLSKDGEAVNMIMLRSHADWVKDETR